MKKIALIFLLILLTSANSHAVVYDFTGTILDSTSTHFPIGSILTGSFFYDELATPTACDANDPYCFNPYYGVPFIVQGQFNGYGFWAGQDGKFWDGFGFAYIPVLDGDVILNVNGDSGNLHYFFRRTLAARKFLCRTYIYNNRPRTLHNRLLINFLYHFRPIVLFQKTIQMRNLRVKMDFQNRNCHYLNNRNMQELSRCHL